MMIRFALPTEFDTAYEQPSVQGARGWVPVDVIATENGTIVYAELPGVKKEDMTLTFEENVLTIVGKRQEKQIPDDARILLHEQRRRDVQRRVRVGHPVDAARMTATLENGLLTVELPKAEAARPRTIAIS